MDACRRSARRQAGSFSSKQCGRSQLRFAACSSAASPPYSACKSSCKIRSGKFPLSCPPTLLSLWDSRTSASNAQSKTSPCRLFHHTPAAAAFALLFSAACSQFPPEQPAAPQRASSQSQLLSQSHLFPPFESLPPHLIQSYQRNLRCSLSYLSFSPRTTGPFFECSCSRCVASLLPCYADEIRFVIRVASPFIFRRLRIGTQRPCHFHALSGVLIVHIFRRHDSIRRHSLLHPLLDRGVDVVLRISRPGATLPK